MKRILIRSGMTPFDNFSPSKVIERNSIGRNSGNLVYAYSIFRTLMTEGTEIDSTYYRIDYTDSEIDEINEKYDCFILPLADGFRESFVEKLKAFSRIIRRLKIPAIVIGVGLSAPFEPNLGNGFPFDETVKEFMDAVLEKSAIVGVRGQITADYLSSLGYIEGLHHMVIGCPSMYMFGSDLNVRKTKITKDSLVCINNSVISPNNVLDFIDRSGLEFPNGYYIQQRTAELKMTYFGIPIERVPNKQNYPYDIDHHFYKRDRVRFFCNFREWNKFMSMADFTFGSRLHGNIASVVSGTPSLTIPVDSRMRELSEYHNLNKVNYSEINGNTSIWDLIEKSDFESPLKNHHDNFVNYRKFLKINEIDNIFENEDDPRNTPFDKKVAEAELQPAVTTYNSCSRDEIIRRTNEYIKQSKSTIKKLYNRFDRQKNIRIMLKERVEDKNKIIENKNRIIADMNKIINLKSVRLAVKASRLASKIKRKK